MADDEYNGPTDIAWANFPGRGVSYRFDLEGRGFEVSLSNKRKKMTVLVDGIEWKPVL